jgi:hypothetical protein
MSAWRSRSVWRSGAWPASTAARWTLPEIGRHLDRTPAAFASLVQRSLKS